MLMNFLFFFANARQVMIMDPNLQGLTHQICSEGVKCVEKCTLKTAHLMGYVGLEQNGSTASLLLRLAL
jgi:hypothetical protein